MPFAVVDGKPLNEMPQDLYIPPDALEVFLEAFEGPLDLLLYLIRRQNLDILDIPIARITEQYMEYISLLQDLRFELAAEYLVMAAILAEIKSRLLLPRIPDIEEDEGDPRAELIRRLQEYERFKDAGERLGELPRCEQNFTIAMADSSDHPTIRVPPQVDLHQLLLALRSVISRAEMFKHHQIQREPLSVRERMSHIMRSLNEEEFTEFTKLFVAAEGRSGIVVTFIALMELLKDQLVEMVQNRPLGPIYFKPV